MKRTPEEHAARFDEMAADYDEDRSDSEEYRACAALVIGHASKGAGETPDSTGDDRSATTDAGSATTDAGSATTDDRSATTDAGDIASNRALTDEDVVLDLGCGTGAIGLALAPDVGRVVGRDISEGMLERAREKADERGLSNVEFQRGSFRDPNYDGPVDLVVSNFAMHHLTDEAKREAIDVVAAMGPRRFVLGDVMLFGPPDPEEPFYDPEVDDPATVGVLADAFTDAGFALTAVEMVHEQVGVLAADRLTADRQASDRSEIDT